jgi:hypothetical protein
MADGFFFPGTVSDPSVNYQLRQKIALAMLSAKKGYPTTLGQGLTAIGDALGDRALMRQLEQADVAAQQEAMGTPAAPGAPQPTGAYTPGDVTRGAADGGDTTPPARAETPQRPDTLFTAPSQPSSMLASATPSGLTAPQPTLRDLRSSPAAQDAGAGTPPPASSPAASDEEAGGYNVIDAQAGTKMAQAPGYVRDAIAKATRNPDMQAYLGNLAAKEGPRPGMVSKSGAAGPFQFVPGTARQYGLTDPNDPDASSRAALQLTADNAAQFQKINGRPPTMAELAVMHQQGGGTGARMVAGTGNAPPRNLLLNNIAADASPQAAVSRINNYYGMPDRAVDPRAGVAQALMAQQGGTPRVMNADDTAPQQTSFNAQNMLPMPSQQAAMPVQQQLAPQAPAMAPQMQIAQAPPADQPYPPPDYVVPRPGAPPGPRQIDPSPEEMQLQRQVNALAMRNPYAAQSPAAQQLAIMQANRAAAQAVENKRFESNLMLQRDLTNRNVDQMATAAARKQEYDLKQEQFIKTGTPEPSPANLAKLNTPVSPQRTGVPTPPPAPPGTLPRVWAEEQTKSVAADTAAYRKAAPQFNTMIDLLEQAKTHPGREYGIGATARIASGLPNTRAKGFDALMKQIEGKNFLAGYNSLRGGGQISNIEGDKTQNAAARIVTSQTKEDFNKGMYDLEHQVRTDFEQAQRIMHVPVTAWNKPGDNSNTAPDIGTRMQAPSGALKEYIGGNPAEGSSWRLVK